MSTRIPPQAIELEQNVLGSMMIDHLIAEDIFDLLDAEDFYKEANRIIFKTLKRLFDSNQPLDLDLVTDALRVKGELDAVGSVPYLLGLANDVPIAAYAEQYALIVKEKAQLRQLIGIYGQSLQQAYDAQEKPEMIIEASEQALAKASRTGGRDSFRHIRHLVGQVSDDIFAYQRGEIDLIGIRTGFSDIDTLLQFGGFAPGTLNVLAARPGMGKSALSANFCVNIAKQGLSVAMFNLEMADRDLVHRMLLAEARVAQERVKNKWLTERDESRITRASEFLGNLDIYLDDDPGSTIQNIRAKARRLHSRTPLSLVVVDYLQLMASQEAQSRVVEVGIISRGLKMLARELDLPVIALSQLSRAVESRPIKRPLLSDLRDSGNIEQDADVVMFIYRDDYYDTQSEKQGVAEIIIAKQRGGPLGTVELHWNPSRVSFYPLTEEQSTQALARQSDLFN